MEKYESTSLRMTSTSSSSCSVRSRPPSKPPPGESDPGGPLGALAGADVAPMLCWCCCWCCCSWRENQENQEEPPPPFTGLLAGPCHDCVSKPVVESCPSSLRRRVLVSSSPPRWTAASGKPCGEGGGGNQGHRCAGRRRIRANSGNVGEKTRDGRGEGEKGIGGREGAGRHDGRMRRVGCIHAGSHLEAHGGMPILNGPAVLPAPVR